MDEWGQINEKTDQNNTLKKHGQLFIDILYWDKVFVLIILQKDDFFFETSI